MKRIVKVLTGNEHGGAANASEWLIDGIISRNEESLSFNIIMLSHGSFANHISSKYPSHTIILPLSEPPVIGKGPFMIRICHTLLLLLWFIRAFFFLSVALKRQKYNLIHTTNNHALIVCSMYRLFHSIPVATHWRRIGGVGGKLETWLTSHVDYIYCISEAVLKSLPDSWYEKCSIIYDGCDVQKLVNDGATYRGELRKYLNISPDVFLFGTIGTYTQVKCHSLLIESCHLLKLHNPDLDFRCVLFGSCPNLSCKLYLEKLKEKIHNYGLDKYVIPILDDELARPALLLGDLDVFVGSTWYEGRGEGFGLIYVEALAQGVPTLAISVGAAPEIITKQVGILASDNSAKQHAVILEELSNDVYRTNFDSGFIRDYAFKFDISNTVSGVLKKYGLK